MNDTIELIRTCIGDVQRWVENHDYKGYEPFDGLSSKFRPLTFGSLFLDRLLLQLVRQSPVNLRPILGVKPLDSTIGRGYMAWGYSTMFKITGDPAYQAKTTACLNWLIENKSPGYPDFTWGKHFDFASRGGRYPAFEPILVWTALIDHAFLDAYEIFGEKRYLEVAESSCEWILQLPRNQTQTGFCLGYLNGDTHSTIHNSNMVAAGLLARTARHDRNQGYFAVAQEALSYSCSCQLPNGAWWYGEDPKFHWIDNFHSGYNLDGLKWYIDCSGDREYEGALRRGLAFYKQHFVEADGRPKYYHNRAFPIDSQCAAQAVDTLSNFAEEDPEALDLAIRVARWTIENMRDPEGFFYYRQYPVGVKAKTPMLHWAEATTFKALALLYSRIACGRRN